jgi:hypothetical protein
MDANYSNEMQSGLWAETSPDECPCRGGGWMHDDYDCTWKCPLHGHDLGAGTPPHPEDEEPRHFDHDQHLLLARRAAYRTFRERTGLGLAFHKLVFAECGEKASPKEQVAAAKLVSECILMERAETQAWREGFSCDLERRLEDEAARERRDRR